MQAAQPAQQQQKVTYTTTQLQPGIKTQFFATSIPQGAKIPHIVQQPSGQQVGALPSPPLVLL